MLHDPADNGPKAVGDRVHIDFASIFEELVDQDRVAGAGLDRLGHESREGLLVVDDLHRPTAQDKTRSDQNGIADPLGDPSGFFIIGG